MQFRNENFYTHIKIIYSSTVTTQLSILFLSESAIQERVKFIAFDAVYCIRRRQFRPQAFQMCLQYFHAISGFVFQPKP